MAGNSFGDLFRVTTFGESHGPALGCIIDGCPPGLNLCEADIQEYLDKRRPGQSKFTTQRQELDQVKILSGVFEHKTTGTPICLVIENTDQKSKDYSEIKDLFRPGHADMTYFYKYGLRDYRGGGRASARETVARVAAGAVAQKYLKENLNLEIIGYLSQMGEIDLNFLNKNLDKNLINQNNFFIKTPSPEVLKTLENKIEELRRAGDSIGAKITVIAKNMPIGLGEPVFDKLDASLAHAMMGINAVKGVEIGDGFKVITQKGSEHRDEHNGQEFLSNHAGGTLGGISSGQDLIVHIAFKPTSSITTPGQSQNIHGASVEVVTKGRHDPCVGIRAVPICEAMMGLVLMDHVLKFRAQCPEQYLKNINLKNKNINIKKGEN